MNNTDLFNETQIDKSQDINVLKSFLPFVKPYSLMFFSSFFLVICITLCELSIPYVTKIAVDRYIVPISKNIKVQNAKGEDGEHRYIRTNIHKQEVKEIVEKYPKLFSIEGEEVRIKLKELSKLKSSEISVLRQNDLKGVTIITCFFLVLIFSNFAMSFLQRIIAEYTGQHIMHDLRSYLFRHIQSLSFSFFNRNPVGRLVTRVSNDINNLHEFFTYFISFILKDFFMLVGIAGLLIFIQWKLALVSFAVLPFVVYATLFFAKRVREVFRVLRIKLAEINTKFSETIAGINVIKSFVVEDKNYENFKGLNHENYEAGMQQIRILAIFVPVIEVLSFISIASVIYYGGGQVLAKSISLGSLVAFISYIRMFFRPIRDVTEKFTLMQNAISSAERIFLILQTKEEFQLENSELCDESSKKQNIKNIQVDNVSFAYNYHEDILKDISFQIKKGDKLAFVGPTGSGKSSLINLIARFYDPVQGRIIVNGYDLRKWDIRAFRSKMAIVMQDPFLFSGSVRENIVQGNSELSDADLERIVEDANCKSLINRFPSGVDTVLSEGGLSLSSGERQLISIARAFARNPELLILDEATSAIDSETEQKIQEAMLRLMKNRTAIVIAHRLSTARDADKIIVLHKGRIIESGTHETLLQEKGFYFQLTQSQN